MNPWKFFDFLDGRGIARENNLIRVRLDSLPDKASAKIDARIIYMQAVRIWPEQYVSALQGWPEIFELRVVSAGSQYRPIFFYGPARGEVTLLYGAIEKGKLPRRILENADKNRQIVLSDRSRIGEHIFGNRPTVAKLSSK
ncbi:MAG: type II toxin-antitoxin system RelE/ParE family toxin [Acidobacteria bacterium]|nr:type II toxin-antitoxin system RelE/ParE family toxin [Acidobacteriota bacterium]